MGLPACVFNGVGVSKTFQILYRNEEVTLDDTIMFRAHILVDSHKVRYLIFLYIYIYLCEVILISPANGFSMPEITRSY